MPTPAAPLPIEPATTEAAPGLRRWTLAFDAPAVEAEYRADLAAGSLGVWRVAVALAMGLMAAFGLSDPYTLGDAAGTARVIRYGAVVPFLGAVLALSTRRTFLPRLHAAVAAAAVVSGLGVVAIAWAASGLERERFAVGVLFVLTYVYTFSRLRFPVAVGVNAGITGVHLVGLVHHRRDAPAALLNALLFLVAFHALGLVACYTLERALRRDFLQRRQIARQAARLAEALASVKVLTGLLPTCAWCRMIRDDDGGWRTLEEVVAARTGAAFSHGICPACLARMEVAGR